MICEYLKTWTRQQVFNKVANHLLQQNKSSAKNGVCLYKGPKGLRCAAGCLIPTEEYSKGLEHNQWEDLIYDGIVPGKHRKLIKELQHLHDEKEPCAWMDGLKAIAKEFNLNKSSLKLKGKQ